jgi:hypothetical protein
MATVIGLFVLLVLLGSLIIRLPGMYRDFQEVRDRWDDPTFWDDDYLDDLR